jgi:periodic tryptophan protein 2
VQEPFHVVLWNAQTGDVLDALSHHTGPVGCLSFSPASSGVGEILASGSWDGTVRLWGGLSGWVPTSSSSSSSGGSSGAETLRLGSHVVDLSWRADGRRLATSTRDGQVTVWDVDRGAAVGAIDVRRDVAHGRKEGEARSVESTVASQYATTIAYTPDGEGILVGGEGRYVCMYAAALISPATAADSALVRRWRLSHSRALDGMLTRIRADAEQRSAAKRPVRIGPSAGARVGDDSGRGDKPSHLAATPTPNPSSSTPHIRCRAVAFSPTGHAWSAVFAQGLATFSLDESLVFDPVDLDVETTPRAVRRYVEDGEWARAMVAALRLNDDVAIRAVVRATPTSHVALVAGAVPSVFVARLLAVLAALIDRDAALEHDVRWATALLQTHAAFLQARHVLAAPPLRDLLRAVTRFRLTLAPLVRENTLAAKFLLHVAHRTD